jgi:hypothetical protein
VMASRGSRKDFVVDIVQLALYLFHIHIPLLLHSL